LNQCKGTRLGKSFGQNDHFKNYDNLLADFRT
jgi:hypothetical protein